MITAAVFDVHPGHAQLPELRREVVRVCAQPGFDQSDLAAGQQTTGTQMAALMQVRQQERAGA